MLYMYAAELVSCQVSIQKNRLISSGSDPQLTGLLDPDLYPNPVLDPDPHNFIQKTNILISSVHLVLKSEKSDSLFNSHKDVHR